MVPSYYRGIRGGEFEVNEQEAVKTALRLKSKTGQKTH